MSTCTCAHQYLKCYIYICCLSAYFGGTLAFLLLSFDYGLQDHNLTRLQFKFENVASKESASVNVLVTHRVTSAECMYVQLAPLSTADQHELREKERMRLASDVTELVCFELAAVCTLLLLYTCLCILVIHSTLGGIFVLAST